MPRGPVLRHDRVAGSAGDARLGLLRQQLLQALDLRRDADRALVGG